MNRISVSPAAPTKKSFFPKKAVAAVCAAMLVFGVSIGAYAYYKTPVSYLSLDINPSVELGVNAFGRVVSATAYNGDGETILQGQNILGSDVQDAVNTLVASAAQNGFVADDGSTVIAVTSETDDSTTAQNLEDAAEQGAQEAVESEGRTAAVQKENVALERRDEARSLGITPGKLNLIQKLQALDPSITVDEYKDAKVTEIMNKYVELKKASVANQNSSKSDDTASGSDNTVSDAPENTSSAGSENQEQEQVENQVQNQGQSQAVKEKTEKQSQNGNTKNTSTAAGTDTGSSSDAGNASHSGPGQSNGNAAAAKGMANAHADK